MDLSTLNLLELRQLQAKVETEIGHRTETTRHALLKQIKEMAGEQGMSLEELLGNANITSAAPAAPKRSAPKKPSVIKYRNPNDPSKGWTGHGRRPQWVLDWLAAGKDLAELAV